MLVSPILHCKTREVDFRSNLLFVPNDFTQKKVEESKKFILNSTYMMEMTDGIKRIIFSDSEHIVLGITTTIDLLYEQCGCGNRKQYNKDINGRTLFGFIGFAIKRDSIKSIMPFEIPLERYLATYEECIGSRWNEKVSYGEAVQEASRNGYKELEFPILADQTTFNKQGEVLQLRQYVNHPNEIFICKSSDRTDREVISNVLAEILKSTKKLSACTNMPNKEYSINSNFMFVSCSNVEQCVWVARQSKQYSNPNSPKNYSSDPPIPANKKSNDSDIFAVYPNRRNGQGQRDVDILNDMMMKQNQSSQNSSDERAMESQLERIINETIYGLKLFANKFFNSKEKTETENALRKSIYEICSRCPYRNNQK